MSNEAGHFYFKVGAIRTKYAATDSTMVFTNKHTEFAPTGEALIDTLIRSPGGRCPARYCYRLSFGHI